MKRAEKEDQLNAAAEEKKAKMAAERETWKQ